MQFILATDVVAIGTLAVTVVAVLTTVIISYRSRQRKALSYRISKSRVVSVSHDAGDLITVLYEDRPVKDVGLVTLRIKSTGNQPIAKTDYERALSVDLGQSAEVLRTDIAETSPADLKPSCHTSGSKLEIEPLLLNPGDSIEVTALVANTTAGDRLDGRIAGVSRFTNMAADSPPTKKGQPPLDTLTLALMLALLGMAFSIILGHLW